MRYKLIRRSGQLLDRSPHCTACQVVLPPDRRIGSKAANLAPGSRKGQADGRTAPSIMPGLSWPFPSSGRRTLPEWLFMTTSCTLITFSDPCRASGSRYQLPQLTRLLHHTSSRAGGSRECGGNSRVAGHWAITQLGTRSQRFVIEIDAPWWVRSPPSSPQMD